MTPKVKIITAADQTTLESTINTFLAPFDPANLLDVKLALWQIERGKLVCMILYQQ